MQKILDVSKIDLYMMKSIDVFDDYMKRVLCVNTQELTPMQKDNATFVFVGRNGKKELSIFPWNQVIADKKERLDLYQTLHELYGSMYKDICYADVPVSVSVNLLRTWGVDEALNQVPKFLEVFEAEHYYPIFLTLHCPDKEYSRCHIHVCCIKGE